MKLSEVFEIYGLISSGIENILTRKQSILLREAVLTGPKIIKQAFDTRKINQETDYIPRRGLQNYHRSEQFISDSIAKKVESFSKLEKILDQLKREFGKQPAWQDSYARVLSNTLNKTLEPNHMDGDFSDNQPSMASLGYLEELMYVRYRLTPENLLAMGEEDIRTSILKKDELLVKGDFIQSNIISSSDVSKFSYEQMMEKMLTTMSQLISNQGQIKNTNTVSSEKSEDKDSKNITINIKV